MTCNQHIYNKHQDLTLIVRVVYLIIHTCNKHINVSHMHTQIVVLPHWPERPLPY